MNSIELLRFSLRALTGHGLRTALSLLGVMIGVAAVVLLTALGEGARLYVVDQFASLGTNLVIVLPGRTETSGTMGIGGIPNDLTLEDAQAIERQLSQAQRVAPISMGTEEIAYRERHRQVVVLGTTSEYIQARRLSLERGEFLPDEEFFRGSNVAVLGNKAARELFALENPVGRVIRVGGWRMRVIGVLAKQGTKMGVNFDDIVIVPVRTGMKMLNRSSLFRVLIQVHAHTDLEMAKEQVVKLITERHEEEDITVITQDAVVSTFSGILTTLTLAVAAIAAISLSVAGIGIMNVMLVSVSERTREIGLLKAVGVERRQILSVFLAEATLISLAGGLIGLAVGWLMVRAVVRIFPAFPATTPLWAAAAALGVSIVVGVIFGVVPARRATALDPVAALGRR